MQRLLGIGLGLAIVLGSCQAGLKSQIQGKWTVVEPEAKTRICEVEFAKDLYIYECTDTPEYIKQSGVSASLNTIKEVLDFELDGNDRIVFTSGGKKYVSRIKMEDGFLLIEDTKDKWRKLARQK